MKQKKATLKRRWNWSNMSWCLQDEAEQGVQICTKWNLSQRLVEFVWFEWLAEKVCKRFGHKWEKVEDQSYSFCTRCGVDTEPPEIHWQ